ncbi:MAG: GAF domain-containing protein [Aeromicrobium sp.]
MDDHVLRRAELQGLAAKGRTRGGAARAVPERVMASWQRSEAYGVSLEAVEPAFTGAWDDGSLFFECGREVLEGLHQTLIDEPVSVMLTDSDGLVLNRMSGDHSLLRTLDDVHLAPGFRYSEREAGTNGLGLALADRVPTLVRAEEHYSMSLCTYTCAAVPVLNPMTGRLEGAINLTTWSDQSGSMLLALAQAAAGNTSSLMLVRARGHRPPAVRRGEVRRVQTTWLEPSADSVQDLSNVWGRAVAEAERALASPGVTLAVGEPGAGRVTLLAQALRRRWPRDRVLCAPAPDAKDVDAWLALWGPEVGKPHTHVVIGNVDQLPARTLDELRGLAALTREAPADGQPASTLSMTAETFDAVATSAPGLVTSIVSVPPLRDRHDDLIPLARHAAHSSRGKEVQFTDAALRAIASCGWPGNVRQLKDAIHHAATRTDLIDVQHLPPEVLSGIRRRLTRIEAFERDEIVRALSQPGSTMTEAAESLGMSRATIYRKVAQYDIHIPRG